MCLRSKLCALDFDFDAQHERKIKCLLLETAQQRGYDKTLENVPTIFQIIKIQNHQNFI